MDSGLYIILFTILGGIFGAAITALYISCKEDVKKLDEPVMGAKTERILKSNNILLKISLLKMIIGFAPKDELGRYYTGVNGFVSDAFCRLGIESHTINEQMALEKIETLDRALGEL